MMNQKRGISLFAHSPLLSNQVRDADVLDVGLGWIGVIVHDCADGINNLPIMVDGFCGFCSASQEPIAHCASATRLPRKPTPYLSTGIPASSISAA